MTGIFTLSLDVELLWGVLHWGRKGQEKNIEQEREVVDALLKLLSKYKISATWAIVGHLFLDSCDGRHKAMPRPKYPWLKEDWYAQDPNSDIKKAPSFYGQDMVEKILQAFPKQEIGCHSFSHPLFGEQGMNKEVADAEIKQCVAIAKKMNVTLKSMVFPQNSVDHLDVLEKYGFSCFRGPDPLYYRNWPRALRKLAHPFDLALASIPPVVEPVKVNGLWNIPGSMLYLSCDGIRGMISVDARVLKAKRGIDAAVAQDKIFHLWFHPYNLVSNKEEMLNGLEKIFAYASEKTEILNMGQIAKRAGKSYR